ncbi:phage tail tape measure protein [Fusobacterium mortiferum]|uniref:phage tail tape measure protein n=1 Tax=Fusobacterium mortiferum TaxID=850 RepID=UPI000E45242A|nr:phage tail tape measure protein [Fusobacterium mortiferum]RGN00759.1 phage tail tape measure protein [Fusobacterium mortiferum]
MIPYSNEYLLQYMATLDTSNYSQGLKGMQNQTEGTTNKIDSAFGKMTKSINAATIAKGAMAAAAIYVANKLRVTTKEVMAYQKQLGMVNTLLKVSRDELNKYGDEFERLSLKTGASKTEIANAAYQALSSGVGKGDLIGFLETASKTAIAGQATVEQSVGTITSIINAYKMEMSEAGKVADWLLTVQNEGVTTVRELGDQLGDVTSISAALGVSLNDVGGAIAQMTVNGNNTAKTITMLKSMLSELSKEGQTAADNFKKLSGQSFTEFIANGGTLQEAMIKMEEYAKKTNRSITDLFGSTDAGSAALNLAGINAESFANKLNKVADSSGELETAYRRATDNIQSEWEKLVIAMDNRWSKFVKSVVENESLLNFVKTIRRAIDGEDNSLEIQLDREKELPDLKKKLEGVTKELEEVRKKREELLKTNPNKSMTLIPTENKLNDEKNQLTWKIQNIEREIKTREEAAKKVEETNQKIVESENKKNTQLQDLRAQEESRLEEHNNTLKSNELKYLQDKKDYIAGQQNLLSLGIINQEEYNRNIKNKENELYLEQQKANLASLKQMEDYYRNIDDLTKANEFKKKVIEVELNIQQRFSTERNDVGEDSMLDAQLQARKEQQASLLENEWLFLQEQVDLYNQGKLSVEDIEKNKNIRLLELEQQRLEQEAQQLEQRKAFYESNAGFEQELADTIVDINQNKIKQEENAFKLEQANKNKKFNWEKWASKYEVDIYERSADAIMDTYTALAQGQIKSLEDFKKFAMLQLAELLMAKGREHAAWAMSDLAIAVSTIISDPPLSASKFAGAAKNAAVAAAFGVASATINNSVNSREDTDNEDNNSSSTQYDEGINDRVESSQEKNEGIVYIDGSNSTLTKLFIKEIEKELNDGYNVTLIGKKK